MNNGGHFINKRGRRDERAGRKQGSLTRGGQKHSSDPPSRCSQEGIATWALLTSQAEGHVRLMPSKPMEIGVSHPKVPL